MEPTTPNPMTPGSAPAVPRQGSSMGILIALVIIVGAVVVGAYYTWNSRIHDRVMAEAAALRELDTMSESTVPEAIEADLAAETPDEFDAELDAAFAELDAAMSAE